MNRRQSKLLQSGTPSPNERMGVPANTRIDAHQHFWAYDADPLQYSWMTGTYAELRRNFEPLDLEPLLMRNGVAGCLAVQARNCLAENDYLLDLADRHAFILGVVGWLDLEDEAIEATAAQYAKLPKFKGVRATLTNANSGADALKGVSVLAVNDLTLDLLLEPGQITTATHLADRFPNQLIVIDHIAKPHITEVVDPAWRDNLTELALRPNVTCKLSSLITQDSWSSWSATRIERYLDHVLRTFGPDRLMMGSDWPVCTLAADYHTTVSVVTDWVAKLSEAEQNAILGGNCVVQYGLQLPEIE